MISIEFLNHRKKSPHSKDWTKNKFGAQSVHQLLARQNYIILMFKTKNNINSVNKNIRLKAS